MDAVQRARRGLLLFLVALVGATFLLNYLGGRITRPPLATMAFPFMMAALLSYSPAIAALIARVSLREGFKDVSFRVKGEWAFKAMLIAWLWPVGSGFLIYGIAWIAGFTRFQWTSVGYPFRSSGPENLIGISIRDMPVSEQFLIRLIACLLFAFVACVQTFGEELGWRGYMLTRLYDGKIPLPIFWNGLIWGLWHLPNFLPFTSARNRSEPLWSSFFFFVAGTVALSYLLAYLRLRSGSIWPAVLAHASGNVVLLVAFDGFTVANTFWKGELYLLSIGTWVLVLMFAKRPWVNRHWPTGESSQTASISQ
jgi:membrane protease YdiL (CAAX protease family)